MGPTKRNTFRLYLNEEDATRLQKSADTTELAQSEVMSKLMSAALRAVEKNGYRMPLPLRFQIVEDAFSLNEEKPKSRR